MTPRRRTPRAVAAVVALLVLLAGCVSVPTVGPIEKIEGQQPACQNCVNVEVAPPAAGDEPRQIVEGYLRATSNYQPNYSVAKQFLTRSAAEKWSAEAGVSIYRGSPESVGTTVTFDGRLVGSLERDRTYTARDQRWRINFGMVRENGEWRINEPPPGLMVAEFSFNSFYQPYDLYFVSNGASLVPEPIYLPLLRNPGTVASALMKALLNGPSNWLKPVVTTALPLETRLSVDSVTITEGVAEVPLTDAILALPDPKRSLLAAQIVYTLKQVVGVKAVVITVNQQKFRVPESDPDSLAVAVDAIPRDVDPIPFVAGEQLYVVSEGAVQLVEGSGESPDIRRIPGPLGDGRHQVDALAVSVANTDVAAVTGGRTTLQRAPIGSGELQPLLAGASKLLRPQFTRYGELWAIGYQGGKQRMWALGADGPTEVNTTVFEGGEVTAFKISPDGIRMALVRRTAEGSELGLARIGRNDRLVVDAWRPLDVTQTAMPQITRIADAAWVDATNLLVLGASSPVAAVGPFRVASDASRITSEGESNNWDAVELAVLLRPPSTAIVVGRTGQTWRDDGSQWQPYLSGVSTVAYPG